jgi:hypothetical protein
VGVLLAHGICSEAWLDAGATEKVSDPMAIQQLVLERLTGQEPAHPHLYIKCYKCGEIFCPRCSLNGLDFVLNGGYICPVCEAWLGTLPSYWTQYNDVAHPLIWWPNRKIWQSDP